MSRPVVWRPLVVAGMASLLLLSCTGGDGGEEVIVDGGQTDPSAVVAEAGGRTEVTSGRVRQSFEMDFSAMTGSFGDADEVEAGLVANAMRMEFEGTFTGSSIAGDVTFQVDSPDPDEAFEERSRMILTDGGAYSDSPAFGMSFFGRDNGLGEQLRSAAAGRTWFENGAADLDEPESDSSTMFGLDTPNQALQILGELDEVRELDPVRVDDVELARFAGRAGVDSFDGPATAEIDGSDDGPDPVRQQRIAEYRDAHQWLEVEVLIDSEGYVRQLDLRSRDEVEERYRDCIELFGVGGLTVSVEFWDLGAPVEIVAPDPADVMPDEEQARVMADWFGSGSAFLPDLEALGGEESMSDGEVPPMPPGERALYEDELRAGAAEIGLDPASIPSMTDDELLAASDRLWDAQEGEMGDPSSDDVDDLLFEGCPE
jgi:hypothetical protein